MSLFSSICCVCDWHIKISIIVQASGCRKGRIGSHKSYVTPPLSLKLDRVEVHSSNCIINFNISLSLTSFELFSFESSSPYHSTLLLLRTQPV